MMVSGMILGAVMTELVSIPLIKEVAGILSGLTFAAIGVWLVHWFNTRGRDRMVVVFPDGCVSAERGRTDIIRWQDVEAVYQYFFDRYVNGMRVEHKRMCTLRLSDGTERVFDEKLRDIELLVAEIHQRTTERLVPRLVVEVRAGRTVEFGKLAVGPQGIVHKKKVLPWSEVAGVSLERGYLIIGRHAASSAERVLRSATAGLSALVTSYVGVAQPGALRGSAVTWKQLSVDDTPNVHAFQQLVELVLEQRGSEAVSAAG
jgi:hypothetical protein